MSNQDIVRGRQVVVPLTNRTGATISLGDVVVTDTTNNESFVTSTTSNYLATRIGVAQETIGIASNGRVLLEGYAPQVNTVASVTRGLGVYHSTTAKKAQDGAQRIEGQFGEFLASGTNPSAVIFPTLLAAAQSSYGSNSNDISSVGTAGSSSLFTRADHVHRGVRSVSHTSNTFFGDVTLASGTNIAITSPSSGTLTITSTASGGGGGSGLTQEYLGYNTAGASTESMTEFRWYAKSITPASDRLLIGVGAYVNQETSVNAHGLSFALWDHNSTKPGKLLAWNLLATSGQGIVLNPNSAPGTARWVEGALSYKLLASTTYWIGVLFDANAGTIRLYLDGSGTDRFMTATGVYATDWDYFTDNSSTNKYSIRADTIR